MYCPFGHVECDCDVNVDSTSAGDCPFQLGAFTWSCTPMDLKVARAIQDIKSSKFSLKVVQQLQDDGFDFAHLNASTMAGQIVCGIVSQNFGLGLKLLTACGIELDCIVSRALHVAH